MDIVSDLQLTPHPEGGFYREYYRSSGEVLTESGMRSNATSIYFYLPANSVSHFHRLKNDELWFHHEGGSARVHLLFDDGRLETTSIGALRNGATPYVVFPRDVWFAAEADSEGILVSCVVAPGFDFADFEIADRAFLLRSFPEHSTCIERCTSQPGTTHSLASA